MALSAKKEGYSFADYLSREDRDRYELLYGEPMPMSLPRRVHQKISGELFCQLANFLEGKKCEVYTAPFAVRLFEQQEDTPDEVDTVVEPDLAVICDPEKLDEYGCKGAPDLIVEILSPSTQRYDRLVKLGLYQQAGVREYWLVDPDGQTVEVLLLEEGRFYPHRAYGRDAVAEVNVLPGCTLALEMVFPKE